jgi:hypothetical protein
MAGDNATMDDTHPPSEDLRRPASADPALADPAPGEASSDLPHPSETPAPEDQLGLQELAAADPADAPPIAERLAADLSAELDNSPPPGADGTVAHSEEAS